MNLRFSLSSLLVAAIALTTGCADRVERAYQDCLAKVEAGAAESRSETQAVGTDISKAVGDIARSAGATACGAMRDACRRDEDGPICAAAMESLRHD